MLLPDECIRISRETSLTIDLFTRLEANYTQLTHRISLLLHVSLGFASPSCNNKDTVLVVDFNYNETNALLFLSANLLKAIFVVQK